MGKSTCAQLLQSRSVRVVDTDDLARQVVEPGQPASDEVRAAFGPQVIASDGGLRRDTLAAIVFSDANARATLERILHPRIRDLWRAQVEAWAYDNYPLAVVVIPLLFETQAENEFEATICVACSAATQRERLLARGWSLEQINQRIQAQMPADQKIAKADFLIWTESTVDLCSGQLDLILKHFGRPMP